MVNISVREHPLMTSAKFSAFLTPFPPCPHLELICSIEFTQPPLLRPLFPDPPPPLRCRHHIWNAPWELISVSEGGHGKADVVREVAWILYYKSVPNADMSKNPKICGCHFWKLPNGKLMQMSMTSMCALLASERALRIPENLRNPQRRSPYAIIYLEKFLILFRTILP